MNSDVRRFSVEREADIKAVGGEAEHRLHALKHLRLKTVFKESHCSPIQKIEYNHTQPQLNNLFCTFGKDQVTVYDDSHMGHYISLVVHYTNEATKFSRGGDFSCSAWVDAAGWSGQPYGDAILAVGGVNGDVSVISVVDARVIALLQGSSTCIVDLCGINGMPGKLLALSKNGEIRLWDVATEQCLASVSSPGASCLAVHTDASCFFAAGSKGEIKCWTIQQNTNKDEGDDGPGFVLRGEGVVSLQPPMQPEGVTCMRFVPDGRLVVRGAAGSMKVYNTENKIAVASWKVPGCSVISGASCQSCDFGVTPDGAYVAAGSPTGHVYVYETHTGKRMSQLEAIRVSGPVRSAAVSADCTHVLAVRGNGFLFNFQYRKPKPEAEATEDKENEGPNVPPDEHQRQQEGTVEQEGHMEP